MKHRSPGGRIGLTVLLAILVLQCSLVTGATPRPDTPPPDTPAATATSPAKDPPTATAETPDAAPSPTPPDIAVPSVIKPIFAVFREEKIETTPNLSMEAIAPDLANVTVPFALSDAQLARLAADGFVVSPGAEKEFFTLYEKARYGNVPIFVTSDSMLHIYHLLFDKVLRTAETTFFIPLLQDLNAAMLDEADAIYQELKGTPWEDAATRTVAFVSVAGRLSDPGFAIPAYAQDLAEGELANIESAQMFAPSPIFPGLALGEDYTQYIPRGHYTRSDALKTYFKSMMWYGRMTFRLTTDDPEVGRAETRSALLLVHALRKATSGGRPAMELWQDLYDPTVFFVGRSDDLNVLQYGETIDAVYGEGVAATDFVDETKLDTFIALADQLPPPKILGMVIMDTDEEEATTKGLRFMGQRFVPDAYIFRQLIYRNVGTQADRRGLPNGLDIPAAMGSERAYEILDGMGETAYLNYPEQMDEVQDWLAGLTAEDWTETLYNSWLFTFYPLLDVPGQGYPTFMQSEAWIDKQLNTVLGSWAELKHDTILYAKQVYAELGGGPPPPPPLPPRGYVEPVPHFYARLKALTVMTREGLADRDMLEDQDANSLADLEALAGALQTMAEKELRGEPLTEEEYDRIRYYGGELEHLTMAASDSEDDTPGVGGFMDDEPQAAVIADVATDPGAEGGPLVLEVAVGRINEVHVVVPVVEDDGSVSLQVAKGGTFSYYEFPWPADDRLTDEAWRQMLAEETAPPLTDWIDTFYTEQGGSSPVQKAILDFQKSVTSAYWSHREEFREDETALAEFGPDIAAIKAAGQRLGHQLVRTHIRSFDPQTGGLAVVTVRETWQDTLYDSPGEWPEFDDPVVAERGPYDLDVTYTVEVVQTTWGEFWRVTKAVYTSDPPGW